MNFYTVDTRRGGEDNANVSRQHSSALHFATVVDFVLGVLLRFNRITRFGTSRPCSPP